MRFNPDSKFDRVIAFAYEAERQDAAGMFIRRFNRGLLTVEDLRDRLTEVVDNINPERTFGE